MQTSTKGTPKSCSCTMCRRGQATRCGNSLKKEDERAYRHDAKIKLRLEEDPILLVGPKGNYYD